MLSALQKGDEVVTAGGIVGRIAQARRAVRVDRDRQRRRDQRPARRRRAAPAQGHDQDAVTSGAGVERASRRASARGRRRAGPHPDHRRMNRYPLWKYVLIAVALVVGIVYTLPNFFPEVPAVQVSLVEGDGEGRHRAARDGRGCAQGRVDHLPRRRARPDRHQGPLRRSRHAAEGEGRAAGQARRRTTSSR